VVLIISRFLRDSKIENCFHAARAALGNASEEWRGNARTIDIPLAKEGFYDSLAAPKTRPNMSPPSWQAQIKQNPMSQVVFQETKTFQLHEKDTGSADVQIVRLTDRINHLTQHLAGHNKDHSTRRGLLQMVARRRKLLDYLKANSEERYKTLLTSLKLRR
jgi:small subunit ribosomal protein S15